MGVTAEYLSGGTDPDRAGRTVAAVAVGVVALLFSSLFALVSVAADAGATGPEQAVRRLVDAAAAEDVLGMLDALAPAERDALRGGLVDLTGELSRLEILSPDVSLSRLAGVDVSFADVTYRTTSLGDGLAAVTLTGGEASGRLDPAALPLGDFVRDLFGPFLAGAGPVQGSGPVAGDDGGPTFAAVREGGRWYVSLWYTVAEAARDGAGEAPARGQGVPAVGASTPDEAVRAFLQAAVHLDARRLVELTPPDEAAALHDYAPLFLPQAEVLAAQARGFFEVTLDPLRLESKQVASGVLVQVRSIGVQAAGAGMTFEYRDGCATFGQGGATERACKSDLDPGDVPEPLRPLLALQTRSPDAGFVTVERDGEWFVSPTRTVLDALVAVTRVLERSDLDAMAEGVGSLLGSGLVPGPRPGR